MERASGDLVVRCARYPLEEEQMVQLDPGMAPGTEGRGSSLRGG